MGAGLESCFRRFFYRTWMHMQQLYLISAAEIRRDQLADFLNELEKAGEPGLLVQSFAAEVVLSRQELPVPAVSGNLTNSALQKPERYFLADNGDRVLGEIAIQPDENENAFLFYRVRPSERRKGYAKAMFSMALGRCRELGLRRVLVVCAANNVAASRTAFSCGGTCSPAEPGGKTEDHLCIKIELN